MIRIGRECLKPLGVLIDDGMKEQSSWYNTIHFVAMILMAAAMPIGYHLGIWMAVVFLATSVIKIIAQKKIGNSSLSNVQKIALFASILYLLVMTMSLIWSEDLKTGIDNVLSQVGLVLFPLCFLLTDTKYLTSRNIQVLGYAFLFSIFAVFCFFLFKASLRVASGDVFISVVNSFDLRHHAYTSLYANIAIIFTYYVMSKKWNKSKVWLRIVLFFLLVIFECYVVIVNSRAGVISNVFIVVACLVHFFIKHSNWKIIVPTLWLVVGSIVLINIIFPNRINKIVKIIENVNEDTRSDIYSVNMQLAKDAPIYGFGVGDYRSEQIKRYHSDNFEKGIINEYNAHNQYIESYLAAGVLGLVAFLFMTLSPVWASLCEKQKDSFFVFLIVFVVMFGFLFESLLNRQMGLLFIAYLFSVMTLAIGINDKRIEFY